MSAATKKNQGVSPLTGREVSFSPDEIIVSKTDVKGVMTYVNDVFIKVSGYSEDEAVGMAHSLVRHPAMPRCVFKLLWDTLAQGKEIFAYVLNRCKNGDEYWVFAHVTPTYDIETGTKVIGYHSSRRAPKREAINTIKPIYKMLLDEEQRLGSLGRAPMEASTKMLLDLLAKHNTSYDRFILSL